jgi:hypothetical protein
MIPISLQTRKLVAIQAVDFGKGIDGPARVCQEQLQADPFSGRLFVFRDRWPTALKIFGLRRSRVLAVPEASVAGTIPLSACQRERDDEDPASARIFCSGIPAQKRPWSTRIRLRT